ncbi:AbrB/MazE/SpoVT family DNA-binding domain-containing protein [Haloferax namakaokahaiae]|uniref:AbrB/MazE/SpoVT family DNA-binding domain-containing protein n=1 Tax=Haloferax namakaokahaiae TaxID=1748331 RepID=A0ABD5ZCY0_9EURY
MGGTYKRRINERGQFTIPKAYRRELGIHGGDEVTVDVKDGELVVRRPVDEDELAEGYRVRAEQSKQLAAEMEHASAEATDRLGEAPGISETEE